MELADTIVLLNHGRIEQVGAPTDLYDRPATDFVMGFLGPVAALDGGYVRPHEIALLIEPREGTREALISNVVHLGFEVRVELELAGGDPLTVQVTRAQAQRLELAAGQIVHVRIPEPALFEAQGI